MPNQESIQMEDMSKAYVCALCAANGFNTSKDEHDNDGVDMTIKCKGKVADDSIVKSPALDVQLKASYGNIDIDDNGDIIYNLEVKNYNSLIDPNRFTNLILILFHMYKDHKMWLEHTNDWLKIRKCAYWISLKGWPPTDNEKRIKITIPKANILTPNALYEIMHKISKDEEL